MPVYFHCCCDEPIGTCWYPELANFLACSIDSTNFGKHPTNGVRSTWLTASVCLDNQCACRLSLHTPR